MTTTFVKHPGAVLDYLIDFEPVLEAAEQIVSYVLDVPTGLTNNGDLLVNANTAVRWWAAGGTDGVDYLVTCQPTTDNVPARVLNPQSMLILVRDWTRADRPLCMVDALLKIQELLKQVYRSTATGGTPTTLVDTTIPNAPYIGGTVFMLTGDNAGRSAKVTNWNNLTKTITFGAMPEAVGAGDVYALADANYTREDLQQALRQALEEVGTMTQVDMSLVSSTTKEDYLLPNYIGNVMRVQVASNATAPYGWQTVYNWRQIGRTLMLDEPPIVDAMPMRLFHNARHPQLEHDAAMVDPSLNLMRLAWTAAFYAALQRSHRITNQEPHTQELVKEAREKKDQMAYLFPVQRMPRDARRSGW